MNYWLMKTEPTCFSIDDLKQKKVAPWDGVRNYQARNFMQSMEKGDLVFIYHSNADTIGIAGIAKVAREAYPDHTSWDPKSEHPDPKSTPDNPRWFMVDVRFVKKFKHIIPLSELKNHKALANMKILQKGSRLSVTPVTSKEYSYIEKLANKNSTRN